MIRTATVDDIPEIVSLGRAFHAASHWAGVVDFDDEWLAENAANWIASDNADVFLSEGGLLIMVACPLHFFREVVAQELTFWAIDGLGNELRQAGEEWARSKGARVVLMGAHEPGKPEVMARWYRMGGYAPFGHSFAKVL